MLDDSPKLTSSGDELKEAVETKKTEAQAAIVKATDECNSLSPGGPNMVEAIQSRVDILSKSRKLPKNVSKEAFDAAKSGLDSMKTAWSQASSAFATGDAVTAAAMANNVKQQGAEVLKLLGMSEG